MGGGKGVSRHSEVRLGRLLVYPEDDASVPLDLIFRAKKSLGQTHVVIVRLCWDIHEVHSSSSDRQVIHPKMPSRNQILSKRITEKRRRRVSNHEKRALIGVSVDPVDTLSIT